MMKHYPQPQTPERLSSEFRPQSGRKFSCRFFILQGIAGEAPGELHGYCMMHAVFADKETVCLDCVPMTVYVLVSERKLAKSDGQLIASFLIDSPVKEYLFSVTIK